MSTIYERFSNDKDEGMDALEFLISITLLARIVHDKKIKLLFDLCDSDEDGKMSPADIL